ncbi:hypothetical protein BV898_03083 [Hypsibius exemplaris]|uniref:Uncharacterized protein n=1 Tax=Hypsibius exemplaris TaxID=2072580 RepID=A0A1W0X6L1_HYPEX|nr:hypothetical protein BV898_03083 [Hypsibius exemplaris]
MDERDLIGPVPRDWDHFTPTSRISFRELLGDYAARRALPCRRGLGRLLLQRTAAISQVCDFWLFQQQQRRKPQNGKNQSSRMNCRKACVPEVSTAMGKPFNPDLGVESITGCDGCVTAEWTRMFSQRFMMTRSNTAPVFLVLNESVYG